MKANSIFFLVLTVSFQAGQLFGTLVKTATPAPSVKTVTPAPLVATTSALAPVALKQNTASQPPASEDPFAIKKLPPLNETFEKLLNLIEKSSGKKSRPKTFAYAVRIAKTCIKELKKKLDTESAETNLIAEHLKKLNEDIQALFATLVKEGHAGNRKKLTIGGKQMPLLSQLDSAKLRGAFNTFKNGILATSLSLDLKDTLITLSDVFTDDFSNKALYPALSFSQNVEGYLANVQQQIEEALQLAQEDKLAAARKLITYASFLATTYFAYREKIFDRPLDMVKELQWKTGVIKNDAASVLWTLLNPRAAGKKLKDNLYGRVDTIQSNRSFQDVIGLEDAVKELKTKVKILQRPEARGMTLRLLLHGPSGTGKTRLAHAFANEIGASLFTTTLADLNNSTWSMNWLFQQPQGHKKSVIFIDEIDKLDVKHQNALLGEMDRAMEKAEQEKRILVIIATANEIAITKDSASLGKGGMTETLLNRFKENKIKVDVPTKEEIAAFITTLLANLQKKKSNLTIDGALLDKDGLLNEKTFLEKFNDVLTNLSKLKMSRRPLDGAVQQAYYKALARSQGSDKTNLTAEDIGDVLTSLVKEESK